MIKITKCDLIAIVVSVLIIFSAGLTAGYQMGKASAPPAITASPSPDILALQADVQELQSQNSYLISAENDLINKVANLRDMVEQLIMKLGLNKGGK